VPDAVKSEREVFRQYIFGTIDDLIGSLEGLDARALNWRPSAAQTNSVYATASHVLGNAEENILYTLCGQPVTRSRATELAASGVSAEALREHWQKLRAHFGNALETLPPNALDRPCRHPRRGVIAGREVLLVVARHAAEHWGEAQLTLSLLRAAISP
jgi:hypothetical protein